MTLYTYHKKFSRFSIGGVSKPISKAAAKSLINKMHGTIEADNFRRNIGERIIKFENGNYIFMYSSNLNK